MNSEMDAVAQMCAAGADVLADLDAKIKDLDAKLQAAQTELATRAEARQDRALQLEIARAQASDLQSAYSQAESYAKLARKTPNEKRAVTAASTAKKAYENVQKEVTRLDNVHQEASQVDDAREQALQKQLHLLTVEQECRHGERASVQQGYDKAHVELGELTYAQLLQGYQGKQKRVDELATQLVAAQVEAHDFHQSACTDLAKWPAQAKAMRLQVPPEDATTRFIEATLAYIDAIAQDALQVQTDIPGVYHVWELLTIPEQQIRTYSGALQERRGRLERLLHEYRLSVS